MNYNDAKRNLYAQIGSSSPDKNAASSNNYENAKSGLYRELGYEAPSKTSIQAIKNSTTLLLIGILLLQQPKKI